jgi:hypothetical protein
MAPITLLELHAFEHRMSTTPSPARRHLAELRQRRAEARRRQLFSAARTLRPTRRQPVVPAPCGC